MNERIDDGWLVGWSAQGARCKIELCLLLCPAAVAALLVACNLALMPSCCNTFGQAEGPGSTGGWRAQTHNWFLRVNIDLKVEQKAILQSSHMRA